MHIHYILNIIFRNRGFFFFFFVSYVCCAVLHFLEGAKCSWVASSLSSSERTDWWLVGDVGCKDSASVENKSKVTAILKA